MKIYKGGVSQDNLPVVTEDVRFAVNPDGDYDFRFEVSAAGGGTSAMILSLSLDDLEGVLEQVAASGCGAHRLLLAAATRSVAALDEELRACADQMGRLMEVIGRTIERAERYIWDDEASDDQWPMDHRELEERLGDLADRLTALSPPEAEASQLRLV